MPVTVQSALEEPPIPPGPASTPSTHADLLLRAAARGDLESLHELLDAGHDPRARGAVGWTALHTATLYNQIEAVQILLVAGAPPHAKDAFGCSAHWLAAAFADDACAGLFRARKRTKVRGVKPDQFAWAGPDTWLLEYTLTAPADIAAPRIRDIARALDRRTTIMLRAVRAGHPIQAVSLIRLRGLFKDLNPLTSGLAWTPVMPDPLLWSDRERRIIQLYAALGATDPMPFRRILPGYDRFGL